MTERLIHPSGTTLKDNAGGVEYSTDDIGAGININHFFVSPNARRKGRGTAIMKQLIREARSMGYKYVVVNMGGGDAAAQFLQSIGFVIVEQHGNMITAEIELGPSDEFGPP